MTLLIGDVHGLHRRYKRIIDACEGSIQVGDMGVGFHRLVDRSRYPDPPHYAMERGNHRFIRGNHDNPFACQSHSQWIPDGHVEGDAMFIGGALSVDREWRTEGYDWWEEEELTTGQLNELVDRYRVIKPRVMITHECPETVAHIMCAASGRQKLDLPSRTRQAFESMFHFHQPEIWVFGHWHYPLDKVIEGTRFVCLAELESKEIEI